MNNVDNIAIKASSLSKTFKLPHEKNSSIKSAVINFWRHKKGYENQQVLKDISFEVKKGEFFGIVGRNGSGKSTLLKMLAGIYAPSGGGVTVNGSLTPFIELGVGFNPELTGRENVFLNGALLGFNRKQMEAKYNDIVKFAELDKFMDQRLKNYSSGMQVRLAFAIAIQADTDILLLDEVLAVGDAAFQQKCNDYFEKIKTEGKTVILVTHDMGSVERFCTRALLLNTGIIEVIGDPKDVANKYTIENYKVSSEEKNLTKPVRSLIATINKESFTNSDKLIVTIEYELAKSTPIYLGLSLITLGIAVIEHNSMSINIGHEKNKKYKATYEMPLGQFSDSEVRLDVAIFDKSTQQLMGYQTSAANFIISGKEDFKGGVFLSDGVWSK